MRAKQLDGLRHTGLLEGINAALQAERGHEHQIQYCTVFFYIS